MQIHSAGPVHFCVEGTQLQFSSDLYSGKSKTKMKLDTYKHYKGIMGYRMAIDHVDGWHISFPVNRVYKSLIPIKPYLSNIESGFYQPPL